MATAPADDHNVTVDYEGDSLMLEAAPDQQITGETTLPTGTTITLRIRSAGSRPFLRQPVTIVDDDGTFSTTVDLARVAPERTFELTVLRNRTDLATVSGEVVECRSDCEVTPTPEQSSTDDAWPSSDGLFAKTNVPTHRGQTVRIPLNVDREGPFRLMIGGESDGYGLNATVRDADGDGRISVRFDTANAGRDGPTIAAGDGDIVDLRDETDLSEPLPAGTYDLSIFSVGDTTGEPLDVGSLSVGDSLNGSVDSDGGTPLTGSTVPNTDPSPTGASLLGSTNVAGLSAIVIGGLLALLAVAVMLGVVRS